jgi:WD40 repeat protein
MSGRVRVIWIFLFVLLMGFSANAQGLPVGEALSGSRIDWSPDANWLALSTDQSVQIVDPTSQEVVNQLPEILRFVTDVQWSPDATRLAIAAGLEVQIWEQPWNSRNARMILSLRAPPSPADYPIIAVDWHPDGSELLVVVPSDVHIFDVATGRIIETFNSNPTPNLAAAWNADGSKLALGNITGGIIVLDEATGDAESADVFDYSAIFAIEWRPDGSELAVGTGSGTLQLLSLTPFLTGNLTYGILTENPIWLAWNPYYENLVAISTLNGTLYIFDVESAQQIEIIETGATISSMVWSPDGSQFAYGTDVTPLTLIVILPEGSLEGDSE